MIADSVIGMRLAPRPPTRPEAVHLAIARGKLAIARVGGDSLRVSLLNDQIADYEAILGLAPGEDPSGGDSDSLEQRRANARMPFKDS